jgi:hypothetical protein
MKPYERLDIQNILCALQRAEVEIGVAGN